MSTPAYSMTLLPTLRAPLTSQSLVQGVALEATGARTTQYVDIATAVGPSVT